MKKYYSLFIQAAFIAMLTCSSAKAQMNSMQPVQQSQSNWLLNIGVGYGNYYGDMSQYRFRKFDDIGYLRNFVGFNQNYIKEPSFHLSAVKRLGNSSTGLGFNFNRTLIQGSDRYVDNQGRLQTNNPNFGRSLNFRTDILDAGFSININGFSKGFFTPYLTLGTGVSFFDVKGDVFTGNNQNQVYDYNNQQSVNDGIFETNLRNQLTETEERYPNKAIYAQALIGFNFRLGKSFSLAVETDVKYSGSDYLDDLSGKYKTVYPSLRSQYIAHPGYNPTNTQTGNRGYNDGVNDFYIQNRIVFRFYIPKYLKRSEVRKAQTNFNAPVLYPSNYPVSLVDSSAYMRATNRVMYGGKSAQAKADSTAKRHMLDSLAVLKADSVRSDSIRMARTVNVKMDTAYVNEVKALREEISGLRQAINAATPKPKDSISIKRATLRDSLNQNLQKLQQKKRKTAADSLQLQIYRLRLDSIGLAEKYAVKTDTTIVTNTSAGAVQNSAVVPATTVASNLNATREDSLRRVIDSLRNTNTANRPVAPVRTITPAAIPSKTVRTIRDTLPPQLTQQYQQQIAGLTYRSQQANLSNNQRQSRLDSIRNISAGIRASDSAKVVYYQNQLATAQQQEETVRKTERRGLLVKKSDQLKTAEANTAKTQASLQTAQAALRQNEQNVRVAAGDTGYVVSLRQQIDARQAEIDSLKRTKKVTDIFSDKNKRIKELEQQQEDQKRQAEEANRMLQYYRNTGPTSYYQPQYYPQSVPQYQAPYYSQPYSTYDRYGYNNNYQNPPVNVVSPVVVSGNNDERIRMQREIDALRSQVAQLRQNRTDTLLQQDSLASRPVLLDSTLSRPVVTNNYPSGEMAALQRQLAELNNRLNAAATRTTAGAPVATNTAATTVYFTRGSIVLATLQKAKLAAFVKKAKKTDKYQLTASSDNTTGNTAANEVLARKRAAAVAAYLKIRGVPTPNIATTVNANNGEPGTAPDPLARKVDVMIR